VTENEVGVVAIGRNEGERLRRCLLSLVGGGLPIVYVDSGSTDGSVQLAVSLGATVVELDLSTPFTAARARNAGFSRLLELQPAVKYVQFVDGDCEVHTTWLSAAVEALSAEAEVVAVCGRRRERFPDASIYNRLCDIEWNTPVGEATACGGDAMFRVSSLREVDGFDATLIAGEEPDLCLRLRRLGGRILRLDAEMTVHDADMHHFAQWWKRSRRAGYAFAQGAHRHGKGPERHWVKPARSGMFYGAFLPIATVVTLPVTRGWSALTLGAYIITYHRAKRSLIRRGFSPADASLFARYCVIGKFSEAIGGLSYLRDRLLKRQQRIIEYKGQ